MNTSYNDVQLRIYWSLVFVEKLKVSEIFCIVVIIVDDVVKQIVQDKLAKDVLKKKMRMEKIGKLCVYLLYKL